MTYYKCRDCGEIFDEPRVKQTTYESYYGAPFESRTPLTLWLCPACGEEVDEDDEVNENYLYEEALREDIHSLPGFDECKYDLEEIIHEYLQEEMDYDDALAECQQLIRDSVVEQDIKKELSQCNH